MSNTRLTEGASSAAEVEFKAHKAHGSTIVPIAASLSGRLSPPSSGTGEMALNMSFEIYHRCLICCKPSPAGMGGYSLYHCIDCEPGEKMPIPMQEWWGLQGQLWNVPL